MSSLSKYINMNNSKEKLMDDAGHPFSGTKIAEDRITILRYRNGFLDGDVYQNGTLMSVRPAVKSPHHIEYWRENKLHHDMPGFAVFHEGKTEYWENGIQIS